MNPTLKIITSTTRPGAKGLAVAQWIEHVARSNKHFDVQLLDLAKINLPMMDEPSHPRLKQYTHEHTKKWSAEIESADAFIIVLGEYNYGFPAPIKNAIDFLFHEWAYKPVGFVTYGGLSGGLRSLQMIKNVVTALKMMPLVEAVNLPFFTKHINEQHQFIGDEVLQNAATIMLAELAKWTTAMKPLRP